MDNDSASAGSSHLTDSSLRTASSSPVLSLPESTSAANPSLTAPIAFPPPPVPWSEPPVPSPLPHPPLLGSNVSFPSPARRVPGGAGVRFTEPSSSPSSPSVAHSSSLLLLPPPRPVSSSSSSASSSAAASSSSSSESASSPSTGSTTLSSSGTSSVSSITASPDKTSSVTVHVSASPAPAVSTFLPSNGGSPSRSFRNAGSPTYSAFASASDSPFFSPSTPNSATPFLTPPSGSFSSSAIHTPRGERPPPVRPNPASLFVSPLLESAFSPPQYGGPRSRFQTGGRGSLESPGPSFLQTADSPGSQIPQSMSPTSAGRPRSCDVFISLYGKCPAVLRFAKWMRAELELQGVACFSADRSLFSDTRSHDITRRIMNSATFGVVIISKSVFRNQWTMEELRVFLDRRNLVPVFFDLAPSDISVRDIVERQGRTWEKYGGELWTLYDGDKAEWKDVVEGVLRSLEWRLEAHDGNWRACIRKAVSLLGTRLGRRSIAEREKAQTERIDVDEFPFPRNAAFTGRVEELKHLEEMLSLTIECPEQELVEPLKNVEGSAIPGNPVESYQKARDLESRGVTSSVTQRMEDGTAVKGKEPEEESPNHRTEIEADREVTRGREVQRGRDMQRGRQIHRERQLQKKRDAKENADSASTRSGCACISGAAGIGKTELALEYAYRNADKYRTILWLSAENRYIRQNYLNLSMFLGVDVGSETQAGSDRGRLRSFDEQETDAFQRVRREMSRDIPYLLIVDNLESERDWWDGKEITELLPSTGGASHVIITTRLPRVVQLKCMELGTLSNTEAVDLMRGGRHLSALELEVLRDIDDKLARLTLGLAVVGRLLGELHIMPSELLELMSRAEGITDVRNREDEVLRNNPHLFRLFNVCFALLESCSGPVKLASKMALVGGWFAPSPISFDLLAQAASLYREKAPLCKCWGNCAYAIFWCCMVSKSRRRAGEAAYLLIQYGIARRSTRQGCVYFSDVIQVFLRRRGGVPAAKAVVQGVRKRGVFALHFEQFWAACFLVLRFGNDPVTVELRVPELLSFTRKVVLPLALRTFSTFTRCQAALELLHLCFNSLDDTEKSFVSQIGDKSFCWRRAKGTSHQVDDYLWHDLTLLKAHLLETRAKLLLRGGLCEAGEEVCRTCISIRMVMLGAEHPDTIAAQETLAKLVRARNNG